MSLFNENMKDILDSIDDNDTYCYIMGDYNINLLNYDTHIHTSDFVDLMCSSAYLPLINRPTRVTENTATLIDNIYTNHIQHNTNSCNRILFTDVSDRFPIFCVHDLFKQQKLKDIYILRRLFLERNRQSFYAALSEIEWDSLYCGNDAQRSFSMFHPTLINLYNKHFPKRRIKIKHYNHKPWLTGALRDCIRTKNKFYRISIKIKTAKYRIYRNKLKHILLRTERKFYADKIEENKSNMKKTWSVLKGVINRNNIQEKFKPSDNSIITDKCRISEKFSEFFINIGPQLARRIPDQSVEPRDYMGSRVTCSIFLEPVTHDEIVNIFCSLKNGSPGYDELTASLLKFSLPLIKHQLVYLCKLSIDQGIFLKR